MKQLSSFRLGSALGLSLLGLAVVVGACGVDSSTNSQEIAASAVSTSTKNSMVESAKARGVVDSLRNRFRFKRDDSTHVAQLGGPQTTPESMLGPRVATGIRQEGSRLHPQISESALRAGKHRAKVSFPVRAASAFDLTDETSHLGISVRLVHATDAEAEVAEGMVVYRGGHASGADIVHRPLAEGTEDFFYFEKAPAEEAIAYQVSLGEGIAGIRLVAQTLEWLDADGTPRLRMAAPYWMDATGKRHEARVEVTGCAYDMDPRGPWGRPVTAPGAKECRVGVSWEGEPTDYPAMVDPAWVTCGYMTENRDRQVAAVLANGRVLAAGGFANGFEKQTAELFDPATNTWGATGSLSVARSSAAGSVLPGGTTVLVAGGYSGSAILSSAEIYSSSMGTWSPVASAMGVPRSGASATLVNGKVLIVGGTSGSTVAGTAEYFNPGNSQWTAAADMPAPRSNHYAFYLTSVNKVLIVGYKYSSSSPTAAYIFDPGVNNGVGAWSVAASTPIDGQFSAASVLPSGKVLMTGGWKYVGGTATYSSAAAIYDPSSNTWTSAANMSVPRAYHFQEKLSTDLVLVAGGNTYPTYPTSAELYNEITNSWTPTNSMSTNQSVGTSSILQDGSVLLAGGGSGCCFTSLSQRYSPGEANGTLCSSGVQCQSNNCVDGVCCNSTCTADCKSCNLTGFLGTCTNVPVNQDDGACSGTLQSCDGAGACRKENGQACSTPTQCFSNNCVDGVCCNNACVGPCIACSTAKTGAPNGVCWPVTTNTDPDNECLTECNGAAVCEFANGLACATASQCQSGSCVDGYCCNSACTAPCQACSNVKTGASNGACSPIKAGADPDNECPTECNGAGACEVANGSACTLAAQCQSGFCVDGYCCNSTCTTTCQACSAVKTGAPNGICVPITADTDPDGECPGAADCNGAGACEADNGTPCTQASQCKSGVCVDGVCCNSPCNEPCKACTTHKTNGLEGTCLPITANTDPDGECPGTTNCNGVGACTLANGLACTQSSECQSGFCVDGVCCDKLCDAKCEACTTAKKGYGDNGLCQWIANGKDPRKPNDDCQQTGGDPTCGETGKCDGFGKCQYAAAGTECGSGTSCLGNQAIGESCDGDGECKPNSAGQDCAPARCIAGACRTTCTSDSECTTDGFCDVDLGGNGTCKFDLDHGAGCTKANACKSGYCVDGFCCNSPCDGLCEACSQEKRGIGNNGACGPVRVGTDPDGNCDMADESTCQQNGLCNGQGACAYWPANTTCGASICSGNVEKARFCSGFGQCQVETGGTDCGVFACVAGACKTSCADNQDCIPSAYCSSGICKADEELGTACENASQCKSGYCADGVCCDSACLGTCRVCKGLLSSTSQDGICGNVIEGLDPRDACAKDLQNTCGRTGTCNGFGACLFEPAGTACGSKQCLAGLETESFCNGLGTCALEPVGQSCGNYVCDTSTGACKTSCSDDGHCAVAAYCAKFSSTCVPDQDIGQSCSGPQQCKSGYCVDGVCCDSACLGTCRICSGTDNASGQKGICGNVVEGKDPDDNCNDNGVDQCGLNGSCNGNGVCQLYKAGDACKAPVCVGDSVASYICNGVGSCVQKFPVQDCFPYACKNGDCIGQGTCLVDGDCAADAYCVAPQGGAGGAGGAGGGAGGGGMGGLGGGVSSSGTCQPKAALGNECTAPNQCASGYCVDGVCCDTACTGNCQACAAAKKQSNTDDGICDYAKADQDPHDDCDAADADTCGFTGECNGFGACKLYDATTECIKPTCKDNVAQSSFCNGNGACITTTTPCNNYACNADATACNPKCMTNTECIEGAYCENETCKPDETLGQACTAKDDCAAGHCLPLHSDADAGPPGKVCCASECAKDMKMDNPCGFKGECNEFGACYVRPYNDDCGGAICISGIRYEQQICNGLGACVPDPSTINPCIPYACADDAKLCKTKCEDNSDCVGTYTCAGGICVLRCATNADCRNDQDCSPEGECIPKVILATPTEACDCQVPGQSAPHSRWPLAGMALMLAVLRRTRTSTTRHRRAS